MIILKKILKIKNIIVSLVILLILWQLLYTFGNFQKSLFPSPHDAFLALLQLFDGGAVWNDIGASMVRFLTGYLLSVACAIFLGLLLGWFKNVFKYVDPVMQLLRPISPMAWMPFIVLWFGIGDIPAIVIIFISAFFPVLLSTASAVRKINPIYLKVAQNFGIKQPVVLWKIVFPAAFPQIANSIHLALGTAWIFLVAGEMAGSQTGLGYLIIDSRNNLRADTLMAVIILIGIIGLILDSLLKSAEKQILKLWGGVN